MYFKKGKEPLDPTSPDFVKEYMDKLAEKEKSIKMEDFAESEEMKGGFNK